MKPILISKALPIYFYLEAPIKLLLLQACCSYKHQRQNEEA